MKPNSYTDQEKQIAKLILSLWYRCAEIKYRAKFKDRRFEFDYMYKLEVARWREEGRAETEIKNGCRLAAKAFIKLEEDHRAQLEKWQECLNALDRWKHCARKLERATLDEYWQMAIEGNLRNYLEEIENIPTPKPLSDCWFWDSVYSETVAIIKDLTALSITNAKQAIIIRQYETEDQEVEDKLNAERKKATAIETQYNQIIQSLPVFDRAKKRAEETGRTKQYELSFEILQELSKPTPKELKQYQLKRAANWIIQENEEGRKTSIETGARQFGNELESEKNNGGYNSVESLLTALYKNAEELNIAKFKDKGRGRTATRI